MKSLIRRQSTHFLCILLAWLVSVVKTEVQPLNDGNVNSILGTHEIVFVNFYADWCRFSQMLTPVFEEASNKVREAFPMPGRVVFGKVDCDRETTIAQTYRINKYPTLKLFRNGEVVKKEYRGQRSADSLAQFIKDQLTDPAEEHTDAESLEELNNKKRHVVGYFQAKNSDTYKTFARVASSFRDDCKFHALFGTASEAERTAGDRVVFRPPGTGKQDMMFMGSLTDFENLRVWIQDKCVPLVREITFENAEELTEEGLPFLILFHNPEDHAVVEKFNHEVSTQLLHEKANVNFLTADGSKFTHPLHHIGKTLSDLPVLAIDSFRHMYIFPHDVKKDLDKPGILKKFIEDLHSGKLHREFHHGPDPTEATPAQIANEQPGDAKHVPKDTVSGGTPPLKKPTSPPESTFRKLAPSSNRYTILKDEL
ncbi:endoplasmic reticulum resident protein 44-like [Haliotis rufescens]|uniref:endoplasmic reticulum resident protein 44-like n=1 Tax=Haliotis rufescens TaxID=6454 RepID=UPI001EAFAACA|nr:endoplasmic reticulum resident protein 44-like [Haliotis rufescens]